MWTEAAKALAKYPEAVVTAADSDGYPVSIRQATSRYDAETGHMPILWPPGTPLPRVRPASCATTTTRNSGTSQ